MRDYDKIEAGAVVGFLVTNLKTLDVGISKSISTGIRMYYKQKYGITYYYLLQNVQTTSPTGII